MMYLYRAEHQPMLFGYTLSLVAICLVAGVFLSGCTGTPAPDGNAALPASHRLLEQGRELAEQYPPPGKLVDVGEGRLHIRCEGTGSPAVVLEAGSTDCSLSWALVSPNVSTFTRVCAYDRQGYGWSDPAPGPITAHNVTGKLHTLLARADIPPPYVIVGHSLGGEYVREYAREYPGEVSGIVLVDPGSEWQMVRTGENFTREQETLVTSAVAGLRANEQRAANGTFIANLSLVPVDPRLPSYEYHAYQALLATRPSFWEARAVEGESAFAIFREVQRDNITTLGEIPLVIISSGLPMGFSPDPVMNEYANTVFRELQKEIAHESPNGTYRVAENTTHYVQLDRPDIVTGAIRDVVFRVRGTPL
jgi:pimeloyl-ACP methyl ester carboxylesterase